MSYNINAVVRRVVLSGSAGTGPYAFSFEIISNTDVEVYKDTTKLTLTTDYAVTINANGTGSVALNTGTTNVPNAPTSANTITIIGSRDIERTTDFVTAGDLTASSLNEQLDSLTIFDQQISERVDRALIGNRSDPLNLSMELPAVDARKGKYLQFNSSTGAPEAGASSSDATTLASIATDIANLADIEDGTVATDAISGTAAIASNVTTVAGVASNVTTVAGISSDVTTVANNVSGVNSFAEKYRTGSSDPTTSLNEGDLFYNTTDDQLKVYNGTAWEAAAAGVSGYLPLSGGQLTGNLTFSGSQTVDGRDVSADGTKLDGIESGANVTDAGNVNPLVDSHLNTSTASASEVLSWTGSDYDWVSTGTKLFDESYDGSSTLPSATGVNSVAVGVGAEADSLQASAFGFGALAKNSYSLALGTSYSGGANGTAIGIGDNSASYGVRSAAQYGIAIGYRAYSRDSHSISIGYLSRTFGNNTISLGNSADAQQSASVAIGYSADADIVGKFAYSNRSNTSSNRAQGGYYILNKSTTDATPTLITTDGGSASISNQISVLLNSATSFSGTIIARESAAAGSDYASWEIKGAMLKNGAGTCVLGNGIVNKIYATSGASTWAVSLSADASGSNLKIQATGQASTSILWVATVNTSEVSYA